MEGGFGDDEVVANMEAVNIDDESDDDSSIDEDREEYHSAVELTEDVMLQLKKVRVCVVLFCVMVCSIK